MSRTLNMCIVNPDLVEEIRKLVGSQAEIMTRVGISWNSLTKIASGMPSGSRSVSVCAPA